MPTVSLMFTTPPDVLFDSVPDVCTNPGERVVRPRPGQIECRRLLPPQGAASAILIYDGTMERLPESVIRFASQDVPGGTIVTASAFVAVPQRDGGEVHVVYPDRQVTRKMREMLTRLGGQPIPQT